MVKSTSRAIFHPALRVYQIWGTRQDVGKTIFSTALCYAASRGRRAKGARDHVGFLKPLSVGAFDQSESFRVLAAFRLLLQGKTMPAWFHSKTLFHQQDLFGQASPRTVSIYISTYAIFSLSYSALTKNMAIKPGLSEQALLKDQDLLQVIDYYAAKEAAGVDPPGGWLFVETLHGVESLLPSGNCQADVYRPLQLPGILVGDAKQDGVDATISAYESLRRRDYDVKAVAIFKDPESNNHSQLSEHFEKLGVPLLAVRPIPGRHPDQRSNRNEMINYYSGVGRSNMFKLLLKTLFSQHNERAKALDAQQNGPSEGSLGSSEANESQTVWDRPLEFSFTVPGKHKHKV